ncbi:MAG: dipeptide epimerase [Eubacteriales bacterium]|nr:dipeptide epimerase [Eubacteriales bacterium]
MYRLEIGQVDLPLRTPFTTALRSVDHLSSMVLCIESKDGIKAYGEAAPTEVITGESKESIAACWAGRFADVLRTHQSRGKNFDLRFLVQAIQNSVQGNTSAKAGFEIALYDYWAKSIGRPLSDLLGGSSRQLLNDLTISLASPETMAKAAKTAIERGYQTLKLKVGQDSALDLLRIQAVVDAVPAGTSLRLDANQGWTAKEAIQRIREIEQIVPHLDFIEQPVSARDFAGLKAVKESVNSLIMADESCFSPHDLIRLLELRACDLLNLKLMKCGGLSTAIQMAELAELYEIPCMLGCMLESNISVSAAAHLAAAIPNIQLIDLDGPCLIAEPSTLEGVSFAAAELKLNSTAGLGINSLEPQNYTVLKEIIL